jgi:hypothetical protein
MPDAQSTRHFPSSMSRLRSSRFSIFTFPFSAFSNRHFAVRSEMSLTHTKQKTASHSNRHILDPLPPES